MSAYNKYYILDLKQMTLLRQQPLSLKLVIDLLLEIHSKKWKHKQYKDIYTYANKVYKNNIQRAKWLEQYGYWKIISVKNFNCGYF